MKRSRADLLRKLDIVLRNGTTQDLQGADGQILSRGGWKSPIFEHSRDMHSPASPSLRRSTPDDRGIQPGLNSLHVLLLLSLSLKNPDPMNSIL